MIGQTILHYEITEKLGEGGMGVVYKAQDTKLDRTVALKFLHESLTPTEEDSRRFIREAKAAAALSHPNICTIHNINEYDDQQFIVMEYIDGETLREIMEEGNLTPETAMDYGSKIADALGKAHQNDIIHRDIKPENIMIDQDGRIKVMDFGLAKLKHTQDITKTGDTVGTLAYMSPEQIQGKQVDHRSDIFSLGIVLYEMLTGSKPFRGEHEAAMTYAIVNEDPAPIQQYLPEAPDELIEFFDKILAKDPDDRIETAGQVAEQLDNLKESSDVLARQTSLVKTERETTEQKVSSGSTVPSFGFGDKPLAKAGRLAGAAALLALVLFAGWWFTGKNASEDNNLISTGKSGAEITDRSIAVLPFTNQGGGEDVASVTQGLHDDLLTRLSNIDELQVTSHTSVVHYRNTDLPLPAVADSLGVQWVVEGSVQQGGNQIQVNAQLIDPRTDSYVWSDHYRQELSADNLFAIQEKIAGEIASALQAELSAGEQERIAGAPTENLEAYQFYIKGRNLLDERSASSIQEAKNYFQQALQEDSSYALAWSGLSDAHSLSPFMAYDSPNAIYDSISAVLPEAEIAAEKALQLAPNLAEAHASMGFVHLLKQEGPSALKELQRAIELKPSYAQAHHWIGALYSILGRPKSALQHYRLAVELNPENQSVWDEFCTMLIANGKYQEAVTEARERNLNYMEAVALLHLKETKKVRNLIKQHNPKKKDPPTWIITLTALADIIDDNASSAKHLLDQLDRSEDKYSRTLIQTALGEVDKAFSNLYDLNIIGNSITIFPLRWFQYYFPDLLVKFRDDPRYNELIRKINKSWGLNHDGSIPEDVNISNPQ